MKMVKSLLLGSAAGLVAAAGAQAADLPVKAKAADPVRICSLYGKGFYYIPGSDMCLSITGFTRFQIYAYSGGMGGAASSYNGGVAAGTNNGYSAYSNTTQAFNGDNGFDVRAPRNNDLTFRTRFMMTFDARSQTAYGTLRSVVTAGFTNDVVAGGTVGTTPYANRAFIQIAGFTMGKAVSFYDFYAAPAYSYYGNNASDTGDGGQVVFGYTARFGGGVSATIAAEEPRRTNVNSILAASTSITPGAATGNYVQYRYPDIVGAIRWDQSWGAFQIMGALHDASAGYYGTANVNQLNSGHPGDTWGWVIGAGLKLNIGADVFDSQINYTQGALRYLNQGISAGGAQLSSDGASATQAGTLGYGFLTDGVHTGPGAALGAFGTGSGSIQLTTAWGFNAAYDHRWSPALKTSIYGGYEAVRFNAEATAALCFQSSTGLGGATATPAGCGQNWQQWYVGSRTQWDVARSFYVGVDVLYTKLETANRGGTTSAAYSPGTPRVNGLYAIDDQDAWIFTFRAHRDIVP